ncbi:MULTISPECIES: glutamate racemase [Kandleria]|jgi:glutamate racemase|uniref:glutamate racemase n=1 Tax=Kandleria TaxID=1279388 RepID=UPI0009BE475F|nr:MULTISPECIES: glutamate racemase [Kandleria]MBP3276364.1 glutamate racemase [Kandleria sp.]
MMKRDLENYIGVFDSGVGGISVLKELTRRLPEENFYFIGDSAHAPYGQKSIKEVQDRTIEMINKLVLRGVKAVVIACNTATSAAIDLLRNVYPEIPIIGVEPALKPAVESHHHVLVMATDNTLKLDKFHELARTYGSNATIIPCVCNGLADILEAGHLDDDVVDNYLKEKLEVHVGHVDSVVLGCTHYPHVKKNILNILGDIPCYDGGEGTSRQLERKLKEFNLLNTDEKKGDLIFASTRDTEEELSLYERIYKA